MPCSKFGRDCDAPLNYSHPRLKPKTPQSDALLNPRRWHLKHSKVMCQAAKHHEASLKLWHKKLLYL